ncbi:MAG: AAA family ATPase [Lachnospiraceae bacterium]|nr:AAA family ATPase [Lachnospiraceae bacterium]
MALIWNVTERSVTKFCNEGKIPGAMKVGKSWAIPDDAKKPVDGRVSSGKYVKKRDNEEKKPLPVGISDYVRAQSEYYYVDKTLLIKDFLDRKPLVSLFTRPRRFGKTLNMDMLRVFFEISKENTGKYFEDKAIWKCGEEYRNHQGKYPVIFLTFKDIKFDTWEATIDKIKGLLQEEYGRHQELLASDKLSAYEKEYFGRILDSSANEVELTSALERLSKMLTSHYGKAPIIIIDEYDTPIQEGYAKDFYEEIIGFMRNFFSRAFKDNKNLSYGFLTGILRIAQESIFSGLNNLTVNSVMDEEYDRYFGFTENEVEQMLDYYGVSEKEAKLKEWYDGYLFGKEEIYNPWSVINYISKGCIPQAYWVNTGKNEVLEDVLKVATDDITERLYSLLQGEKVIARIDQNVVYRSLTEDAANIYSLLLVAGYLKTPKKELQGDGSYLCEVSIPNKEIAAVYKNKILSHLLQIGAISRTTANKIAESLYANDDRKLQGAIAEYMDKAISFYDAGTEYFYHGLMLGLIALMDNRYKIKSNRESGDGRYDISMFPKEERNPGIIMELKWKKALSTEELDRLAEDAFAQIEDMRYDSEMKEEGIKEILKFGIAFTGKKVCIKTGKERD